MKKLLGASFLALLLAAPSLVGQDETKKAEAAGEDQKPDVQAQLNELIKTINTSIQAGKSTETALAEDIKKFDQLLAENKDDKSDAVARVLFMKAMLYHQVIKDLEKTATLMSQVQTDFPDSSFAANAGQILVTLNMVIGKVFPDFNETDLDGKPLSVAQYKGKVVLIDFWATWCGPCINELPHVKTTYTEYHDKGFEIIGISLDQSEQKLRDFIKKEDMTWVQFFDGKGWQNKVAQQYGIRSIPATFLLDGEGKIIAKDRDLRGPGLERAVAAALSSDSE